MTSEYTIIGGGIVGLVLALALHEHLNATSIHIYEKVASLHQDVGAGMGLYPNGNRVLRDINEELLQQVREAGHLYDYRRWDQHDGNEIITAEESALCRGEEELESIGIRRWRLQTVLYEAVLAKGIQVHFEKALSNLVERSDGLIDVVFQDRTTVTSNIVFGCDGSRSKTRSLMAPSTRLRYTGVTCLMGMAPVAPEKAGITFLSARTTKCHGVVFPTQSEEQCFQIHFPVDEENADPANWSLLSETVGQQECHRLSQMLHDDGWADRFVQLLEKATHAVRIGFCTLQPPLKHWTFGKGSNIVLVGDAAHPPVPYTGQGAQLGIEDVGTLTLLMKKLCLDSDGKLSREKFGRAMALYQQLRVPRIAEMLKLALDFGHMQQKRSESEAYDVVKQQLLRRDVFFHETMSSLLSGTTYNYKDEVDHVLETEQES